MLAFIEDIKKEFSEAFEKERDYQVTKEDLKKMFKILNKHIFRNDFDRDRVVVDVIDYSPSIKVYGKFGLSRDDNHVPTIFIVKHSSDRFSQIVSVLCHEMIHLRDFKHGELRDIYDKYGDIEVRKIEGREYVHGYHVHGNFFKSWISISKKRAHVIVKVTYDSHSTKKLVMEEIENELPSETPFADYALRKYSKQKVSEAVDNQEYKDRLEAFAKSLKGTNAEFKYIDEKHWAIFFD